ncbi:hypothetical protein ACVGXS_06555, partial [Enterobacter hormaechei]
QGEGEKRTGLLARFLQQGFPADHKEGGCCNTLHQLPEHDIHAISPKHLAYMVFVMFLMAGLDHQGTPFI